MALRLGRRPLTVSNWVRTSLHGNLTHFRRCQAFAAWKGSSLRGASRSCTSSLAEGGPWQQHAATYPETASPGPRRCAPWRLTMVQHFQTLPEIGRSGLKVCTILKSTKLCRSMALLISMKLGTHLRQFGCSVHAPKCGKLGHSLPGNSGGNSPAIPGNSEACSAIRVFCACPKRGKFGHSLPRQFPFEEF